MIGVKDLKKVVYLMEYPIDLPGGAQLSTISICNALIEHPECGYEPVVICPELLNKDSHYDFTVRTYPMGESRIKNLFIRIKAFLRLIREEKPDLIHIEMSESLITYGFIRKFFKNIPYLYTDRGMYFGYRTRSKIFMMPVLKDASMLVTTTEKNRGLWESNSTIRPLNVIYNTISPVFSEYDESRKKRDGMFTIGFAGRICIEKDWPFVPVLVKALRDAGLKFRVHLVLSLFEKGDAEQAAELRQKIGGIIGEENLIYEEDLSQEEMSRYYYGLDLFLMTSQFESFGKAAVEAMSRKCAVLSTEVGGLPEVIGDPQYLYTKDHPEIAVERVKSMMDDPEVLRRAQEYFYMRYRDNFTESAYLEKHLRVYREILGV